MANLPTPREWDDIRAEHRDSDPDVPSYMPWDQTLCLSETMKSASHGTYVDVGDGWVEVGELFRAMHDLLEELDNA